MILNVRSLGEVQLYGSSVSWGIYWSHLVIFRWWLSWPKVTPLMFWQEYLEDWSPSILYSQKLSSRWSVFLCICCMGEARPGCSPGKTRTGIWLAVPRKSQAGLKIQQIYARLVFNLIILYGCECYKYLSGPWQTKESPPQVRSQWTKIEAANSTG